MAYFIAANWKMYKTPSEAEKFCTALKEKLAAISETDILIAPAFPAIERTVTGLAGTSVHIAAQDIHFEKEGAYTGAVSAEMVKDLNCSHVIVGHSERRNVFGDSNETVGKKLKAVLNCGLNAIVCAGEKQEEREAGKTLAVVEEQLNTALSGLEAEVFSQITIAYEPVWAIGTGLTASPEDAQEVHAFIRSYMEDKFNAGKCRILYGGSVKPDNVEALLSMKDIDGGLIGGASLKVDSFFELISKAEKLSQK